MWVDNWNTLEPPALLPVLCAVLCLSPLLCVVMNAVLCLCYAALIGLEYRSWFSRWLLHQTHASMLLRWADVVATSILSAFSCHCIQS